MRTKWISALTFAALFSTPSQVLSWGTSSNPQIPEDVEMSSSDYSPAYEASNLNFPLNEDQDWLVKGALLIWKPYEDDVDTGIRLKAIDLFNHSLKMKHPDYSWSPGVRVGIGKYLPEHEWWDVSAFMTYFYNQSSSHTSPDPADLVTFESGWSEDMFGAATKSAAHTRLNLYIWDLSVGRNFAITPKIIVHPFFGARGVIIDQKYSLRNTSGFAEPIFPEMNDVYFSTSFKAKQRFYGVGARIGSDFLFHFDQHWSLIANFSSSFLWARYHLREKFNGIFPQFSSLDTLFMHAKDADDGLRTNLEGAVGLGWESWLKKHTVRIATSLLFEVSEWYAVNHWFSATSLVPVYSPGYGAVVTNRHYGDLGFMGGTLNIELDY